MENCEVKYDHRFRNFATQNVTVSALAAVFGLDPSWKCWLKHSSGTYIFPDEQGCFPTLDSYGMYDVEVCGSQARSSKQKRSYDSSDESTDSDFYSPLTSAYKSASQSRKGKGKGPKISSKGKRPVPTRNVLPLESWFFKITIGEWKATKKIEPVQNFLIQCNAHSTCTSVKEELAREMKITCDGITLYDSDLLEVTDSTGRVGKYWSGTRKIFAVVQKKQNELHAAEPSNVSTSKPFSKDCDEIYNTLNNKLDSIDQKIEKTQLILMKGYDTIFKEISMFIQAMFLCPICQETSGDEFPHATSCCNHIFCLSCVNELAKRNDEGCPLCKQRRGPPYPIILSGIDELLSKVKLIPLAQENYDQQDSAE